MSDDFIDLDFDGVSREGGTFTLLEEGKHILTIANVEIKPAASGEGKVAHIKYDADGSSPMDWFSLNKKALFGFRNWLETVTGQEFEGQININKADLIGMKVGAFITIQENPKKFDIDVDTGTKVPKKMNVIEAYFPA